jgi:hypothetical protein
MKMTSDLRRQRFEEQCRKLDPEEEQRLADIGLNDEIESRLDEDGGDDQPSAPVSL